MNQNQDPQAHCALRRGNLRALGKRSGWVIEMGVSGGTVHGRFVQGGWKRHQDLEEEPFPKVNKVLI